MTVAQRNYNAFQYLLKKKPREYRGVWFEENFTAYHLYQVLIPGFQIGRFRELFHVRLEEVQSENREA